MGQPKIYQSGTESGAKTVKNVYQDTSAANSDYTSDNFGTDTGVATCNLDYTDVYGKNWNFCGVMNVPYTDYKISPAAATDVYWATIPVFADIADPIVADEVRLLSVDCAGQTVTARSKLTGDYHLNSLGVPATGDLKVKTHIQTTEVSMTYDTPTDTWTGTLGADCTGEDVTVTSYISSGGTAFFDQTP